MNKIYKYEISLNYQVTQIMLPENSKVLSFQLQNNIPTLWVMINENQPVLREFYITGTGILITDEDKLIFIGTIQQDQFVWHLFEIAGDK